MLKKKPSKKDLLEDKDNAKKSDESFCLESAVEGLIQEADVLTVVLDQASIKIRKLEKSLRELKAHFPFKSFLGDIEKDLSKIQPFNNHHKERFNCDGSYQAITIWGLSWQKDEKTRKFRLFLIASDREKWFLGGVESGEILEDLEGKERTIKPLIETNLETRLRFSPHLVFFVEKFREHLKIYRSSIKEGLF